MEQNADDRRAGDQTSRPAKPAVRRKFLLVGGGVLIVSAVVVGLGVAGVIPGLGRHAGTDRAGPTGASAVLYAETPELVTNLDAGPHRVSFVKFQCRIEVHGSADQARVMGAMPRLVDMLQAYIREVRPEEIRSETGTYLLHEAFLARAAIAVPDAHVTDVLFEELLVQ